MSNKTKLIRRALELWKEREMRFPSRVRRMTPDDVDMISGSFGLMLNEAMKELDQPVKEEA